MTVQTTTTTDTVAVTIDGLQVAVPKGTLVIRAAELLGIAIPRFCDHPLLDPIGACRQCLVEIEGQRKPLASCTTVCTDGMVVKTQLTSAVADKAQQGVMEFLLINHPLDCPMCDKGGECPLQNQAMSNGRGETRFIEEKREFVKPVPISTEVLLDRERCISCTRCVRTSEEIAGDDFIEFFERGPQQFIGTAEGKPFNSYFSGNTVQVCPVGALTGAQYRFKSRPFDLVSTPSVCEHCASGCRQRTDHRRGTVLRRLAGEAPEVNEEWNCDKGRWAFQYATQSDRLTTPLVRDPDGVLRPASWPAAYAAAAAGLLAARDAAEPGARRGDPHRRAPGAGGRLRVREVRAGRPGHQRHRLPRPPALGGGGAVPRRPGGRPRHRGHAMPTWRTPGPSCWPGFEPEEESPIVFLRLRKAARKSNLAVYSIAALATPGLAKVSGTLLETVPGGEPAALTALAAGGSAGADVDGRPAEGLGQPGAVILVGERLAEVPGALAAAARLADATGAKLAWVPRRAGERGAVEAGALPGLLPVGRPVISPQARAEVARAWNKAALPTTPGRDTHGILAAAARGELGALIIAGVDPADLPDPAAALRALEATPFIVSLELRASAVTDRADVVFPVAAVAEKPGTFVNWEGRGGTFAAALKVPGIRNDLHVLGAIADEMDVHLGLPDAGRGPRGARRAGDLEGRAPARPGGAVAGRPCVGKHCGRGGRVLRPAGDLAPVARQRPHARRRAVPGGHRPHGRGPRVRRDRRGRRRRGRRQGDRLNGGRIGDRARRGDEMVDGVVWLPANSPGSATRADLVAGHGSRVTLRRPE